MKKNIYFIIFFQIIFSSSNHAEKEDLRKKLKDYGYFCRKQDAAWDIFRISNNGQKILLEMISKSSSENDKSSLHCGEKIQLFHTSITSRYHVNNASCLDSYDNSALGNSTEKNETINTILKAATYRLSDLTGEDFIGVEFKLFEDTSSRKNRLFWHQDVWRLNADPKYLAFAVLGRFPDTPCTHTIPVAQELGLVDYGLVASDYLARKNHGDFIDDKPLQDSPDLGAERETSENVSFLARQDDNENSGYVVNQFRVKNGKKIVHRRTERPACLCFKYRTTLVARVKSLKKPL